MFFILGLLEYLCMIYISKNLIQVRLILYTAPQLSLCLKQAILSPLPLLFPVRLLCSDGLDPIEAPSADIHQL